MSSFHEMVGQHRPIQILQSILRTKAVPNALLFSGEEGIGKRSTAMIFIQTLLCQEPTHTDDEINPCGHCRSCKRINSGNHTEFFVTEPPDDKSMGTMIKIDQIRGMQEKIIFEPIETAWKVFLIVPAEKMTLEAQNSLLKTLEEPPHYAVIILISSKPSLLVPTIVSRCQKISFSPLSLSQIESILVERKRWTPNEARLAAALTGGNLGEALSLEVDKAHVLEEEWNALVKEETLSQYDTLFSTATQFSQDAAILEKSFYYLSAYFRDLLVLLAVEDRLQLDPSYLVLSWRREELLRWADRMDVRDVTKFLADITTLQQSFARNINRQLALETLLMQMRDRLLSTQVTS